MTTPDIERTLTAVLQRRADDAMSRTDTGSELQELEKRLAQAAEARTRRWVVGAAAALTAAAMALGAVWSSGLGTAPDSGPVRPDRPTQTAPERVAQRFAEAFAAGDNRLVATSLAERTAGPPGWRHYAARAEAWSMDYDLQTCQATSTTEYGTNVECPFDFHSLRSEELGLGPFGTSSISVVVDEGKVRTFRISFSDVGGGEERLYQDIGAWVRENRPGDWAFLSGRWSLLVPPAGSDQTRPAGTLPRSEKERWIRLWQQRTRQYVDAMSEE
jgi:hypothetical protein